MWPVVLLNAVTVTGLQYAPAVNEPLPRAVYGEIHDAQKDLLSASFSQANAYTNLVLGAGYAGFFATWAFTKDHLPVPLVLWSALLVTISLFSFVAFEVYKNFYLSKSLLALAAVVQDESQFAVRIMDWKKEQTNREITFGRIWASSFWIAVMTGFGGGLILLIAFVRSLLQWYTDALGGG